MGGLIEGPQIQAHAPQQLQAQVMRAPQQQRPRSIWDTLLGVGSVVADAFVPGLGAGLRAANSIAQGDVQGGFEQGVNAFSQSQQTEKPADTGKNLGKDVASEMSTKSETPSTPVDKAQEQAATPQQQQIPPMLYMDPILMWLLRQGMMPGMGEFPQQQGLSQQMFQTQRTPFTY